MADYIKLLDPKRFAKTKANNDFYIINNMGLLEKTTEDYDPELPLNLQVDYKHLLTRELVGCWLLNEGQFNIEGVK